MIFIDIHSFDDMSVAVENTAEVFGRVLLALSSNHRPFKGAALIIEADVVQQDIMRFTSRAVEALLGKEGKLLRCSNLVWVFSSAVAACVGFGDRTVPASGIIRINGVASIVAFVIDDFAIFHITTKVFYLACIIHNTAVTSPNAGEQPFFIADSLYDFPMAFRIVGFGKTNPLGAISAPIPYHTANAIDGY